MRIVGCAPRSCIDPVLIQANQSVLESELLRTAETQSSVVNLKAFFAWFDLNPLIEWHRLSVNHDLLNYDRRQHFDALLRIDRYQPIDRGKPEFSVRRFPSGGLSASISLIGLHAVGNAIRDTGDRSGPLVREIVQLLGGDVKDAPVAQQPEAAS